MHLHTKNERQEKRRFDLSLNCQGKFLQSHSAFPSRETKRSKPGNLCRELLVQVITNIHTLVQSQLAPHPWELVSSPASHHKQNTLLECVKLARLLSVPSEVCLLVLHVECESYKTWSVCKSDSFRLRPQQNGNQIATILKSQNGRMTWIKYFNIQSA